LGTFSPPSLTWKKVGKLRVLDFDPECRPMHYSEWRDESQITAIAWGWVGQSAVEDEILKQDLSNEQHMLARFLEAYGEADILTGHYIEKHDLPLINDHCMRYGWPKLTPKLVQDTRTLLPKVRGLGLSQENLGTLFELDKRKHHMNGRKWAVANALSDEGRDEARTRVVADVRQHKPMRQELLDRGYLKPPRMWSP
jgi:DNA polymerase elongation subunit (family B)